MAVVFFESFTVIDTNVWTLTPSNGVAASAAFTSNTGLAEGNGLLITNSGSPDANTPGHAATATFLTQSSGKVYIGFRWRGLAAGAFTPNEHKAITFLDGAGSELCSVYLGRGASSTALSVIVKQGATTRATYTLSAPQVTIGGWANTNDVTHWEFELDPDNDTIAIRVNGQYLTGATPASPLVLATAFASVGRVTLWGYQANNSATFDDLFVVNDSGTYANTWLGVDTRVRLRTRSGTATNSGWTGNTSAIDARDGDAGSISTKTEDSLFALAYNAMSLAAGTAIGAVKVSSVARAVSQPVAYKHVFHNEATQTTYEVGDAKVMGQNNDVNYPAGDNFSLITYMLQNPATSAQWTPSELDNSNSRFGVKTVAVPP